MLIGQRLAVILPYLAGCLPVLFHPNAFVLGQLPEGRYLDVKGTSEGPLGDRIRELIDVINSGRREFA
ncbi:MAG: hypothetical protein ACE5HE_08690, partial [Phycisphaerae bacterium]